MTLARGELMFRGQCLACHTVDGYRGMRRLLHERNEQAIGNILAMLHRHDHDSPYRVFMPPLVGRPDEIAALTTFLNQMVLPSPVKPVGNP